MSSDGGTQPPLSSSPREEPFDERRCFSLDEFPSYPATTPVSNNGSCQDFETPVTPTHKVNPYPLELETPGGIYFPLEPMTQSESRAPQLSGTSSTFFFGVRASPSGQHADIVSPSTGKRERLTLSGKKQAAPRRIGQVWDDIDHVIFDLKTKSYSNKEVADEIKQLGVHYDPKTIGTRFLRLKARTAGLEKEGKGSIPLHEWTTEQDAALMLAFDKALDTQSERIARIKAKFWADCAENISKILNDAEGLNKEVCRYRWTILTNHGTNRTRELESVSETPVDAQSTVSYENLDDEHAEQNAKDRPVFNVGNTEAFATTYHETEEDNEKRAHLENLRRLYGFDSSVPSTPSSKRLSVRGRLDNIESPTPKFRGGPRLVNLADPRSVMLSTELDIELKNRGLSRMGTKQQLMNRLNEDDARRTIEEHQARLAKRGLPIEGTKEELIQRIRDHDVANCEWGKKRANAALELAARGGSSKRHRTIIEESTSSKRSRVVTEGREDLS